MPPGHALQTTGAPAFARTVISRVDLLDRLDAFDAPLTLISAPAGFGKSVLAAQWCQERVKGDVTWSTVRDGDPIDAVDAIIKSAMNGEAHLEALKPTTVVIRDRRLTIGPEYVPLAAAIEAAGSALRLVVLTRSTPPAEFAALRLRGTGGLLTGGDLELSAEETATIFQSVAGVETTPEDAKELLEHTHGWITATVLAAMSLSRGATFSAASVMTAAADAIDGYLTTEVLAPLPDHLRRFLALTAALPRLTPAVCDAVAGGQESDVLLRDLRRTTGFVRAENLDQTEWSYHPQFARAVLTNRDADERRAEEAALRAAAAIYATDGLPIEAAKCFARLKDWDAFYRNFLSHGAALFESNEVHVLVEMLQQVPPAALRQQMPWAIALAMLKMVDGNLAAALDLLSAVQPLLTPDEGVRADCVRVVSVGWVANPTPLIATAERAIAVCDELGEDHVFADPFTPSKTDHYRTTLRFSVLLAGAYTGEWARMTPHLDDIAPHTRLELPQLMVSTSLGQRATYYALAGEADKALRDVAEALDLCAQQQNGSQPIFAEVHLAYGEALRLEGRYPEATDELELGLSGSRELGRDNAIAIGVAALAAIDLDSRRPDAALERVNAWRADSAFRPPQTIAAMLAATEARALARLGHRDDARDVLEAAPATSATATATFAIAMEASDIPAAQRVIATWPHDPTPLAVTRLQLCRMALLDATGQRQEADQLLRTAIHATRRLGLVQPFVDLATGVGAALRRARIDDDPRDRVFERWVSTLVENAAGQPALPISSQESIVMGHLARGNTLAGVAAEMFLSVNTVKTHVKSVYRKLGVSSRAEALAIWRSHN